jgi:tetratricopeptide (TPR) repeat protein
MIVKNEAQNLPRCLNSARSAVNEMIVLDTGSTDNTVDVARSLGAIVHHFPWNGNFSDARNDALTYVTSEWVLVLDADEVLAADIAPHLAHAMQQDQALVVNLVRQEVGAVQSPYSLVSRLFRNHPDLKFSRPYHAIVDDSVAALLQREPHWRIVTCPDVAILHEGYAPDAIASRQKLQTAKAAMEAFLADHPTDAYTCSKLGALYVQLGEIEQGIRLLQQGLRPNPDNPTAIEAPILYELHYHLGIAHSRLQQINQAQYHYQQAIDQPLLPSLKLGAYNNLGNLLRAKGDLAAAKTAYELALSIDPNFALGHYNLGMALKATDRPHDAIAHYQTAIALNPSYADAYQNMGVALMKLGRVPESLAAFQQAIALHNQTSSQEGDRLRQELQAMGFRV